MRKRLQEHSGLQDIFTEHGNLAGGEIVIGRHNEHPAFLNQIRHNRLGLLYFFAVVFASSLAALSGQCPSMPFAFFRAASIEGVKLAM